MLDGPGGTRLIMILIYMWFMKLATSALVTIYMFKVYYSHDVEITLILIMRINAIINIARGNDSVLV